MVPVNASDQNALSASVDNALSGRSSGQTGQFINFVAGKGNTASPAFTDSSSAVPKIVWLVLLGLGCGWAIWFFIIRRHR